MGVSQNGGLNPEVCGNFSVEEDDKLGRPSNFGHLIFRQTHTQILGLLIKTMQKVEQGPSEGSTSTVLPSDFQMLPQWTQRFGENEKERNMKTSFCSDQV